MIGCYYRRVGADRDNDDYQLFEPTDSTRSNWDRSTQHGSPPLALLTKLVEERAAGSGKRIGRICFDMLGPIPVSPVRARAWIERPGRRIAMYAADMVAERTVARMSAWLLATSDTADVAADRHRPLVEGDAVALPDSWARAGGYIDSLSLRRQQTEPDAAAVYWLSSRLHVVDKLPNTPSRKAAAGFGARIVTGGFSGSVLACGAGLAVWGALLGVIGAVVGTLGGYQARSRLAGAVGRDLPVALLEDAVAVLGALAIVGLL